MRQTVLADVAAVIEMKWNYLYLALFVRQVVLADVAGLPSARARLAEGGLADSAYRLVAAAADEPVHRPPAAA